MSDEEFDRAIDSAEDGYCIALIDEAERAREAEAVHDKTITALLGSLAAKDAEITDLKELLAGARTSVRICAEARERERARADKAEAERDAARKWAEESVREVEARERLLTCAFCGHEFPPGTPPSQHEALERHVAECPKHPMRVAEARAERLAAGMNVIIEEADTIGDARRIARASLAEEK